MDLNGLTVFDALCAIASPKRGVSWTVQPNRTAGTCTIVFYSTTPTAYTGSGSFTLAASTKTATATLTGPEIDGATVAWAENGGADIIEVIGARPLVTMTLDYDKANLSTCALEKGWDGTEETSWDAATANANKPWRFFTIRPAWNGSAVPAGTGSVGLRNLPTFDGSSQYTGARTFDSAQPSANGARLQIERFTSCSEEFGTDADGPRQPPCAFHYDGTTWYDHNGNAGTVEYRLETTCDPAGVILGGTVRGVGSHGSDDVKGWVANASGRIAVTVGIRETHPLRVSWRRAPASWPRDVPRVLSCYLPDAEQWIVLAGTRKSTTATVSTTTTIRDDLDRMKDALALLRAFYADPIRTVEWTSRGTVEYGATLSPGTLLTSVTLASGAVTVNCVITRRHWTLTEDGYGTHYETSVFPPDFEAKR